MSTNTDTTTRAGRGGNARTGRAVVQNSAVLDACRDIRGEMGTIPLGATAPRKKMSTRRWPPWRRYPHPQVSTGS